jgi:oxygen-independent coproporphyrinogen-3 oxidase
VNKCPYCCFNSYPINDFVNIEYWRQAFLLAIDFYAKRYPQKIVSTIYFGGGTPSLLHPSFIKDLLTAIFSSWQTTEKVEISIEANPHSSEAAKICGFAQVGVNRISVGVQSLSDDGLIFLGRKHNVETAIDVVKLSSQLFESVSVDMIYGRPGHSVENWNEELDLALTLPAQHLSLYQLTVEANTVFGEMHKCGELLLPSDDECADMFDLIQEKTKRAGFIAYEVSNHALPTHECLHNMRYWQYQDYIGIGPGAHGRISHAGEKYATLEETNPEKWVHSVITNKNPLVSYDRLSREEQAREALLMGLRIQSGIDCTRLPMELERFVDHKALRMLVDEGFLEYSGCVLRATDRGVRLLNSIISMLLKYAKEI